MSSEKQIEATVAIVDEPAQESKSRSKEERWLLWKLDFFILTYFCLSYFVNFLDRASFANAYVSGLKEALDMAGNEYNQVLSWTTAGLAIGQIPHALIIQKVRPRIWFPSMVLLWGSMTLLSAAAKDFKHLCVIRFFLGFAEGSTYPGAMYIISSWYKPNELVKRTALFSIFGQVGTMSSGAIQTGINTSLHARSGLAGWQWLFIIDGIITIPVAIFGLVALPDVPGNTKAFYLSEDEKALALSRVPAVTKDGRNIGIISLGKRVLTSRIWNILFWWSPICATLEAVPVFNIFLLWLKHNKKHFPVSGITSYPIPVQAVGIVSTLLAGWYMDTTGRRVPVCLVLIAIQVVVASLLLVPDLSFAGTFTAFYLSGASYAVNDVIWGWANIILQRTGDDALRSVALFTMNIGSMVLFSFWGLVFYSAADVPYWKKGSIVLLLCCGVMFTYTWVIRWLDKWTVAKYGEKGEVRTSTEEA